MPPHFQGFPPPRHFCLCSVPRGHFCLRSAPDGGAISVCAPCRAPLDVKGTYFYNRIAFAGTYIPCPKHMETYRSGHNGAHSKCVSRFPARGFESLRLRQIPWSYPHFLYSDIQWMGVLFVWKNYKNVTNHKNDRAKIIVYLEDAPPIVSMRRSSICANSHVSYRCVSVCLWGFLLPLARKDRLKPGIWLWGRTTPGMILSGFHFLRISRHPIWSCRRMSWHGTEGSVTPITTW